MNECDCQSCRMIQAIELAKNLMRGDLATLKAGYTIDNAAIAAAEVHGVDREVIRQHLTRVLHCK